MVRDGSSLNDARISCSPGVPRFNAFSMFCAYFSMRFGGKRGSLGSTSTSTSAGPLCANACSNDYYNHGPVHASMEARRRWRHDVAARP